MSFLGVLGDDVQSMIIFLTDGHPTEGETNTIQVNFNLSMLCPTFRYEMNIQNHCFLNIYSELNSFVNET